MTLHACLQHPPRVQASTQLRTAQHLDTRATATGACIQPAASNWHLGHLHPHRTTVTTLSLAPAAQTESWNYSLAHCAVETNPLKQKEHVIPKTTSLAIGRTKDREDHVANGCCIAASLSMTCLDPRHRRPMSNMCLICVVAKCCMMPSTSSIGRTNLAFHWLWWARSTSCIAPICARQGAALLDVLSARPLDA